MKSSLTFLVLLIFALAACNTTGSQPTRPNIPGKIVFAAKDDSGTFQIYTMQAVGRNVKQLTHFEPSNGGYQPSWSPDGSQIVFITTLQSSSNGFSLFVMNADGSNRHPMHPRPGSPIPTPGNHARWSPDGAKIVFDHCVNCQVGTNIQLFVYNFTTDSVTQLTDLPYTSNTNPTWSPDGSRIAFVSGRDYVNSNRKGFSDLYVLKADRTDLKRLTKTGFVKEAQWNPEGNSIIFRSIGSNPGLYSINLQSRDVTLIKKDLKKEIQLHPVAWNSTGTRLLIVTYEFSRSHKNVLYILNIKNGRMQKIYSKTSNNANFALMGADWFVPNKN